MSERFSSGSSGRMGSPRRSTKNAAGPAIMYDYASPSNANTRPRSSKSRSTWLSSNAGFFFIVFCCFMALCRGVDADRQLHSSPKLGLRSGLLVDLNGRHELPVLKRMQRRDSKGTATSSTTSLAIIQASTATLLGSTATGSQAATAAPTASPTSLPQVFDSNIANNFTSSTCPTFFQTLVSDAEFQECYPLSLLLTVSSSINHQQAIMDIILIVT